MTIKSNYQLSLPPNNVILQLELFGLLARMAQAFQTAVAFACACATLANNARVSATTRS